MDRWPDVLTPSAVGFWLETPAMHGPPTVMGNRQVVASDAGIWRASYEVPLHRPNRVLAFRAFMGIMEGPVNPILCSPFDCRHDPIARTGIGNPQGAAVPYSDDAPHSDESLFAQGATLANFSAAAALRATTILVRTFFNLRLEAGQYIGISDRLYRIKRAFPDPNFPELANRYQLQIWPPLRAAAANSEIIEIEKPVCPMRIVGDIPRGILELGRFGRETVEFIEVFT